MYNPSGSHIIYTPCSLPLSHNREREGKEESCPPIDRQIGTIYTITLQDNLVMAAIITDTPLCGFCHHKVGGLHRKLHHTHNPHIRRKIHSQIHQIESIMHTHTTRDDDNVLVCPTLKTHYCAKCKHEGRGIVYGHTPSRCSPCEYCHERGHNDRECPKKRADEKSEVATIVFKIPKKEGWEKAFERFLAMSAGEGFEIVKEINTSTPEDEMYKMADEFFNEKPEVGPADDIIYA